MLRWLVSAAVAREVIKVAHCWWQAKEKANRVEEQLQELTSKLAAMETEKHSLAARNKVLETALATAKGTPGRVCLSAATSAGLSAVQVPVTRTHLKLLSSPAGRRALLVCMWHPGVTQGQLAPETGLRHVLQALCWFLEAGKC